MARQAEMSLPAFVDWFRSDLAYKPPESWPDHLEWFFGQLKHRFGAAVDPEPKASGIFVTSHDVVTGEHETVEVPVDDYLLITVGTCYRAEVTAHASGTHVITVKGRRGL